MAKISDFRPETEVLCATFVMPVRFAEPSETGGVIVKEILVSDDDRKTNGSRRDKLAIKIRILPRKKRRPKVGENWSKIDLVH